MLLLNTDAFVAADTLTKTVSFMDSHPECGVLGVKLIGRRRLFTAILSIFPDAMEHLSDLEGICAVFSANPACR